MLINLSENICVSRYQDSHNEQWVCYEQLGCVASQKRPLWKKVTGFMSAGGMQAWLAERYPGSGTAGAFLQLSGR